jgi:hypothetical protein
MRLGIPTQSDHAFLSSSAPNGSKLANSNRPKGELILQVMLAIKYYRLINLHSSLLFRY